MFWLTIVAALATNAKIVNGQPAAGAYPETVSLAWSTGGSLSSTCTGSLIAPEWVLTAAHCVDAEALAGAPPNGVLMAVWGDDVYGNVESLTPVADQVIHPGYETLSDGRLVDDVALVRLASPRPDAFQMALNDAPVDESWRDQAVTFVGFGITAFEGGNGGVKRFVDVPVEDWDDTTLYTFDGTHSTCQGDSGGPGLVHQGTGYVQVAITSYGVGCGEGAGGSMRVDRYLDWIVDQGVDVRTVPAAPPDFVCSHSVDPSDPDAEAVGVVPFELKCVAEATDEVLAVDWRFGDGGTAAGVTAAHEYTTPGNHTVTACFTLAAPDGSTWEHCVRRVGKVRACGVPEVAIAVSDGLDPLQVELHNETDLSAYGCHANVLWTVFDGEERLAELASWSPTWTAPAPGRYRVQLEVAGPAGAAAATLPIDVRQKPFGCDQSGGGASWFVLGVLALVRRRAGPTL